MRETSRHDPWRYWPLPFLLFLVVYSLYPVRDALPYLITHPLAETVEVLTYIFSFPLGPVTAYNLYTYDGGDGQRLLLWSLALAAGYFQWFVLVPALLALRRPAVTTLNLTPADTVAPAAPAPAPPAPKRLADKHPPPVPLYDAHSHTPLERIINGESGRQAAGGRQ